MRVCDTVGGAGKVILQYADQFARRLVCGAEGQIVGLVAHPDRPVAGQPFDLLRGEEGVRPRSADILFKHPLVIEAVFILDPIQRGVQLVQQIGTVFADREEEVGRADLAHRRRVLRMDEGIDRDIAVQLAGFQHCQRFVLGTGDFDDLRPDAVALGPVPVEVRLDAVLVHADPLAVLGGGVRRQNALISRRGKEIVLLRAHGERGKQHAFGALGRVGDVAHQVDLARFEHRHQLRPASPDILVGPARIAGDLDLILVGIAGAASVGIHGIVGGIVPADAHMLTHRLLRRRVARSSRAQRQQQAEQKENDPFGAEKNGLMRARSLSDVHVAPILPSGSYRE